MSLSLLSLMLLPLYLKMVIDPKGYMKLIKEVAKSPALSTAFGLILILISTLIFSSTGFQFTFSWEHLITWLGLLIFIKGAAFMIPDLLEKTSGWMKEKNMPILGFIGILLLFGLVYVDTQLI